MKRYKNFDEIDRELKYLRLKSKISLEEMKLGLQSAQEDVKEAVSPANLLSGAVEALANTKTVGNFLNRFGGSRFLSNGLSFFGKRRRRRNR